MTHRRVPQPFTLDEADVLDYESARTAGSELNRRRVEARKELESAIGDRIEAETVYRKARATKLVEVDGKNSEARKAQIESLTADEWQARERAQMRVDIWNERLEEIDGQRATLHRLIEWSAKLDPRVAELFAMQRGPRAA